MATGGEWISSIDLENIAHQHPGIAQAAAIAVPDAKWGERPIVVAVRKSEAQVEEEDILELYRQSVPRWSVPDTVIFVAALPVGGTGKIVKKQLRQDFADGILK